MVINNDAGLGKAGGGRAGLESKELKAKISGLSVASNFARTCLNRFFFNINGLFVAFSQNFEGKKRKNFFKIIACRAPVCIRGGVDNCFELEQVRYVLQSARKCSCVDTTRKQKRLIHRQAKKKMEEK